MMGRCHLISALLLLLASCSVSQNLTELTTTYEETSQPLETLQETSTDSPPVQPLEAETQASSAVPNVPESLKELFNSPEPTTGPNNVASSATTMNDIEVKKDLFNTTLTKGLHDPSTRSEDATTTDEPTNQPIYGSRIPVVDHGVTNPPTSQTETVTTDDERHDIGNVTDMTVGEEPTSRLGDSSTTKRPGQETSKDVTPKKNGTSDQKKDIDMRRMILIIVIICILILLLATMIFFLLRKKKRSGSFRTQSRKGAGQNVWAGQVPQLGEGRPAEDPAMVENGRAGTGMATVKEQEMTTFGEKKPDSMVEMDEVKSEEKAETNEGEKLGKEEEKTPLMEDASQEPSEPEEEFPGPPMEQELLGNGV
ncbi:uncharacterized protein [Pyxicephalus adspersus]|uniref:uncharacterized protein n=1 Tax=Pyxicephalus adspersus TaxID=30357 RepID=UPI003B59F227